MLFGDKDNVSRVNKTRFTMVRFGNVLGSSGSVIPLFHKQIKSGGPLTVTHPKITRYFMTIPEAAQLVIQAGSMGLGGDVFVLDMGEPVRIVELAEKNDSSLWPECSFGKRIPMATFQSSSQACVRARSFTRSC
nr:hypothetical protein GCM10020185_08550 [Pseudomonas brassicacearum subsp. brassicacearum]